MTCFMEAFAHYGENHIFDEKVFFDLKLCLEEWIVNIFKHGYEGIERGPLANIQIDKENSQLIVQIVDNAKPFNPMNTAHQLDVFANLEERPIGGLGLHLIKELSDSFEYYPLPDGNKVIISKRLEK